MALKFKEIGILGATFLLLIILICRICEERIFEHLTFFLIHRTKPGKDSRGLRTRSVAMDNFIAARSQMGCL